MPDDLSQAAPAALDGWRAATARRVFLRDLTLPARIGVHAHERLGPQTIQMTLDLEVAPAQPADRLRFSPPPRPGDAAAQDVVCYQALTEAVEALLAEGHIDYVETLAEQLAALCLSDDRVRAALVRIEKPDAIPQAAGAGVEILRRR